MGSTSYTCGTDSSGCTVVKNSKYCTSGCNASTGVCNTCAANNCTSNNWTSGYHCVGSASILCTTNSSGCTVVSSTQSCSNGCSSSTGKCNNKVCNAGSKKCDYTGTWVQTCNSSGSGWSNTKYCAGAANATGSCSGGVCKITCKAPYKDCDSNMSNGCEIPVGRPNSCNKYGQTNPTNPTGCGTPHCGTSSDPYNQNQTGNWYCAFCDHCHKFATGYSWCLYGSMGNGVFSPQTCTNCCKAGQVDKVCY